MMLRTSIRRSRAGLTAAIQSVRKAPYSQITATEPYSQFMPEYIPSRPTFPNFQTASAQGPL